MSLRALYRRAHNGFSQSAHFRPIERLEGRTLLATFTVTTVDDAGPGSLRQAILDANATPASDTITFDIPGSGVHTIAPRSPLPAGNSITNVDGTTQPGYAGLPLIELNGSAAGAAADGLALFTGTVRGLIINRFGGNGIAFVLGGSVQSSYVGTDATGAVDLGNGGAGIVINGVGTVGGARGPGGALGSGNVISGNGAEGIRVGERGSSPIRAVVAGNYVGTSASGTAAIGNGLDGVRVLSGSETRVGGAVTGEGNLISGNGGSGIRLAAATRTVITGNKIGTDVTGTRPMGNGGSSRAASHDGITSDSGSVRVGPADSSPAPAVERNLISANAGAGVRVFERATFASGPLFVVGNYIGTDAGGAADLGNGSHGVWVSDDVGGLARVSNNLVSGNDGDGVRVDAGRDATPSTITLSGNFIGTALDGATALGNLGYGVNLLGPARAAVGVRPGVVRAPGAAIRFGNDSGNLISGNGRSGVNAADAPAGNPDAVQGAFALTVQANFIGTDAAGNARVPNRGDGVTADGTGHGGSAEVFGSLVSGNDGDGVRLVALTGSGTRAEIGGNFIGTNAAGAAALGNGGDGVELNASSRLGVGDRYADRPRPGGVDPTAAGGNLISANGGHGVYLTGTPARSALENHQLYNNLIGTDSAGTAPLGNGGSGIFIDSGTGHWIGAALDDGNVISANGLDGITIMAPAGRLAVSNNWIGTDPRGNVGAGLGNRRHGVAILGASDNTVDSSALFNTPPIAGNGGAGVYVEGAAAQNNVVSRVPIFDNGGLGIDLSTGAAPDGVTANDPLDADEGPNRLQNFPVIRSVVSNGLGTVARFEMHGEPDATYWVQFYSSDTADPSGHGEGMTFRGMASVTTDAAGNAADAQELSGIEAAGKFFTATAAKRSPAGPAGGTSEFSAAVRATEPGPASVVGRHVFYNGSSFDGGDAAANASDDAAVAPDKTALLPGAAPSFANVTSYTRGINGVIIDVADLAPGAALVNHLTADDFLFRRTSGADGSAWTAAASPASVTVRRGAGSNGSDRVILVWPDATPAGDPAQTAVANGWLEVMMRSDADTGLAQDEVFAFGNLAGDTGDAAAPPLRVSALDLAAVKRAINTDSPITGRVDFNRDGRVNALDLATVRANLNRTLPAFASPPATASLAAIALKRRATDGLL